MSGPTASQALQHRFDAIRRAELERLKKKLAGLSDADRAFVDQSVRRRSTRISAPAAICAARES